ncbi:hypothetical protein C8046_13435 [Serinibacter arcticus]|uniref:CHAT domain-containing protein n=1 Tax=Serinibacter arcticus TaxID=1655435 RepID=A0A2U1ZX67_9MICO|nr:CHAT domain-containing protein [Serinibacter arcticus]PWD51512.1 hypothetical protein C8046_13435 [Serinibacter arcticus]
MAVAPTQELYREAVTRANAGHLAAALRLLDRAEARGTDPDVAALILGTRAYVLAERGDPGGAQELCRTAMATPGIHRRTTAVLAGQLGLVALRGGDVRTAGPMLDLAVRGLDHEPRLLGQVLLNRGMVAMERDRLGPAEADFRRAVVAFEEAGDAVGTAKATHNAGVIALLRGDLVEALHAMDAARDVLAPISPMMRATCDGDRADLLQRAGMPRDAVPLLVSASAAYGRAGLSQLQAETDLTLARTVLPLDPGRALAVARRAQRRFVRAGNPTAALRAEALVVRLGLEAAAVTGAEARAAARTRAAGGRLLARADDLVDRLAAAGMPEQSRELRRHTARAAARLGDVGDAVGRLRRVRVLPREPLLGRVLHREVSAEVAALAGRRRLALQHAFAGISEVTAWQDRYEDIDLRTSLAVHGRQLLVTGIETSLALGDAELVLAWAELTRGVVSRAASVRVPAEPHLEARGGPPPDPGRHPLAALRGQGWRLHERPGGPPDAEEGRRDVRLRSALAEQEATLVSFVRTDVELAAVVVTPDRSVLVRLGAWAEVEPVLAELLADLDVAALDLPGDLQRVVAQSLQRRLAEIAALVLDPVLAAVGLGLGPDGVGPDGEAPDGGGLPRPHRLVITAPAALSGVPWSMVPGLGRCAVTIPETVTDWLRRLAPAKGTGGTGRERRDVRLGRRAHPVRAGFVAGPRLTQAETEVRAAATAWPGAVVIAGDEAGTAQLSRLAARVDVLHVAAHGRHSADNPLFSGLELADGAWFGYDIEQLERVPDYVVLSSCELGRSSAVWGRRPSGWRARGCTRACGAWWRRRCASTTPRRR